MAVQPFASAGAPSRERILEVAATLFGRHGFDGVTTRRIAAAAGLNVATVAHHTGSKAALYQAVFERAAAQESALLDAALAGVTDADLADPHRVHAVLRDLVDAYVDVLRDDASLAGLWSRRWLERGAVGDDDIEERFARPLFARVECLLVRARELGSIGPVDAHLAVKSVVWISYGWFTGGLVEDGGSDVRDDAQLARLRRFLHGVVASLLGPVPA